MADQEPDRISPEWRLERGALERTFELEDDFAAQDLADRLTFFAGRAGARPTYRIENARLTVRSDPGDKEAPSEAELSFARKADRYLRFREDLAADRNLRPARALIRLWLEAQDRWETALLHLRPQDLDQPVRPGAKEKLFEEAARHPVSAGFGYLNWIREKLDLPDTKPAYTQERIQEMKTLDDVFEAGRALRQDLEATVAKLPDGAMFRRAYLSRWGEVASVDQMLEHAVMHLHRHRLQVEDFVEARG